MWVVIIPYYWSLYPAIDGHARFTGLTTVTDGWNSVVAGVMSVFIDGHARFTGLSVHDYNGIHGIANQRIWRQT